MEKQEKAVITVVGKDMVGILAKVSGICAEKGVNVLEVTQSILQDMFVMVMMVDITHATAEVGDLASTQCTAFKGVAPQAIRGGCTPGNSRLWQLAAARAHQEANSRARGLHPWQVALWGGELRSRLCE